MTNFQTALEAMAVMETDNREVLWHGKVRFERSAGKTDRNAIDLPKFLHELCSTLLSFDPHFLFRDKNGDSLSMDALPNSQESCELLFNYQVIEKRNTRHMLFVADMITSKSIGQLKNAAWSVLKKFGIWMFRHSLAVSRLDVNTSGWIFGANPRYHSSDLQRNFILQELDRWWKSLTPTVRTTWDMKLSHHRRPQATFPDFYCNPRTIKGEFSGIISTASAFSIVTAAEDTRIVDDILKAAFPPESNQTNNDIGIYIPMELRRTNASHFLRLVQRQQEYIDAYQIVSIAGITKTTMGSPMKFTKPSGETLNLTVQEAFQLDPSINRVDPSNYLVRLGKWNVSTTKDQADAARNWVDTVLEAMPAALRDNTEYESFPTATRMKAAPSTAQSRYANIAGAYSVNSLKAHQDARQKHGHSSPRQYTNPQEPITPPMAIFTSTSTNVFGKSYSRAASYADHPAYQTPSDITGYGDSLGQSTIIPTPVVPPWLCADILQMKKTIANLQNSSTTSTTSNTTNLTSNSDLMQMFQQIHQGMQESKTQLSQFQQSMELKSQTMDTRIRALQTEQTQSKTRTTTFQDDIRVEMQTLRSENQQLHSRIDNLANDKVQTPITSPRRKKFRETPEAKSKKTTAPDDDFDQLGVFDADSDVDTVTAEITPNEQDADEEMMDSLSMHRVTHDYEDDTNIGPAIPGQEPAFPAQPN